MKASVIPFDPSRKVPLEERSDDELMLLSGQRRDAFEHLVRRHASRILTLTIRAVGSEAAGNELAQEVWLTVWRHRDRYRANGTFDKWLLTLALNRIRNFRRNRVRRAAVVRPADDSQEVARIADSSPGEIERLLAQERRHRLQAALLRLKDPFREALLLRFTEDLSYDDIAAVLEVNESTARSRVFYGLKELRRHLQGEKP